MREMNAQSVREELAHEQLTEISTSEVSADVIQREAPDQEQQEEKDVLQHIASQIGEDPAKLTKRADMGAVLKKMQEGIVIKIHVSRPRFWKTLDLDDLGLAAGSTLATSEAASRVIDAYFRLGKRGLLPPELQKRLANIEAAARFNLQQHSFKSHWGAFVPRSAYKAWKEENEALEAEFWSLRDKVLQNYDAITEQVVEDARPLAEDAWKRVTLGAALLQQDEDAVTHEMLLALVGRLRAGQGKTTFIDNYLDVIREAIPEKWEIEDAFKYEVERAVVPLPSLVAKDMESADRIYQERALEDARTRAELEAIEARRRAEMQKLSLQQQQERQAYYDRLRREQEQQRLQWEMERDVLSDARKQKERLVKEFYDGIVAQINSLIFETTENVLESLDANGGIIRGRVSLQLRNLIKQMEQLHFVENEQIEDQLNRLRNVIPSTEESEKAAKGLARINTTRMATVVRAIHQEVSSMQIDLSTQPRTRSHRHQPLDQQPATLDATRRKARPGAAMIEQQGDQAQAATPRKRRQKRAL